MHVAVAMRTLDELTCYWMSTYGNTTPIRLRDKFNDRWVRFHSLPDSKRYADSEAEYLILLKRYNSILAALAENRESLLLLTAGYSETSMPVREDPHLAAFDPRANHWWSIAPDDDASCYRHLFVSEWTWEPNIFDPLLRLVADDTVSDVHLVNLSSNWVLHPYDGGTDVILASINERDRLSQKFCPWLSQHEDGL